MYLRLFVHTNIVTHQHSVAGGNTEQRKTRKVNTRAGKNVQRGVEDAPLKTDLE